jgi:uncharacterized protein
VRERILELIDGLRGAGLRVSVAETIDAVRAVEVTGVERTALREALAASLVKHEEDRGSFDAVFDTLFAPPAAEPGRGRKRGRRRSARGGDGPSTGAPAAEGTSAGRGTRPPDEPPPSGAESATRERRAGGRGHPPRDGARSLGARPEPHPREAAVSSELAPRAGSRAGRGAALLERPFHAMEPAEADAAREWARELGRRLAARSSRRERRLRRGRIDVRRTIRASLSRGGVPIELERRGRRPGKPDLLVLCDVSGSVALASELLLGILATAESAFRRVHRFAFVDRAVEIAFRDGHVMPAGELDLYARSDFGAVLCGLEAEWLSLFDRSTVLLVVGDARNNRLPARADVLRRLGARSRAVVWAVAEPRARWYTGDSALASYEPHCDFVVEATSLAGLLSSLRESLRR